MRIDEIKTSNFTKMNLFELNNNLIESGFSKKQADTLCNAFDSNKKQTFSKKEANQTLATKEDLKSEINSVNSEISSVKKGIENLKHEMNLRFSESETASARFQAELFEKMMNFQNETRGWMQKTLYINYSIICGLVIRLFFM